MLEDVFTPLTTVVRIPERGSLVPDTGWFFKKQRPGDTTREPIQGEFFSTEAISNTAEALIREGIQNSLDAGRDGQLITIRIRLSGMEQALPPEAIASFLDGAWSHFHVHQNGLREPPGKTEACPFLTFEDFGTTGLEGDPAQWHKQDGVKNGFFTFFRAEGQSDKGELDRGRWGVGKTVFPRSSRISTFWGVTIRASDHRRLLMGRAILKSHAVEGTRFVPDGYFGTLDPAEEPLVLPLEDEQLVSGFLETFALQRGMEPGLSIVVPWYDVMEITRDTLLRAVIQGYFSPILAGNLVVTVIDSSGDERTLSAASLVPTVRDLNGDLASGMVPLIELASWSRGLSANEILSLNHPPTIGPLRWTKDLFGDELTRQLREKLHAGERIAVRVPMRVQEKGKDLQWSFFDVFLVRDGTEDRGRPVFIREGIIISDVRSPLTRGIRSLVVVEDRPLASLLGDSENPAHTQWQKDCSNYKGKYTYGPENLSFVINSVSQIVKTVSGTEEEADPAILVDLFSLPAAPDDMNSVKARVKKNTTEKKGPVTPPVKSPPTPKPKSYRIEKITGGFRVLKGDAGAPPPDILDIRVAYDVRKGNALTKYDKADFQFGKSPIQFAPDTAGVEVLGSELNRMRVKVTAPDFRVSVTGFDGNRDLLVRVTLKKEELDDDQPA